VCVRACCACSCSTCSSPHSSRRRWRSACRSAAGRWGQRSTDDGDLLIPTLATAQLTYLLTARVQRADLSCPKQSKRVLKDGTTCSWHRTPDDDDERRQRERERGSERERDSALHSLVVDELGSRARWGSPRQSEAGYTAGDSVYVRGGKTKRRPTDTCTMPSVHSSLARDGQVSPPLICTITLWTN